MWDWLTNGWSWLSAPLWTCVRTSSWPQRLLSTSFTVSALVPLTQMIWKWSSLTQISSLTGKLIRRTGRCFSIVSPNNKFNDDIQEPMKGIKDIGHIKGLPHLRKIHLRISEGIRFTITLDYSPSMSATHVKVWVEEGLPADIFQNAWQTMISHALGQVPIYPLGVRKVCNHTSNVESSDLWSREVVSDNKWLTHFIFILCMIVILYIYENDMFLDVSRNLILVKFTKKTHVSSRSSVETRRWLRHLARNTSLCSVIIWNGKNTMEMTDKACTYCWPG